MIATSRRIFLRTLAFGSGLYAASKGLAAENDGSAAGYDVRGASDYLSTIPRKPGDSVVFTASLDKGPIKATSGGWAREITSRGLPIATGIAGAHLYINAGGSRRCTGITRPSGPPWTYGTSRRAIVTRFKRLATPALPLTTDFTRSTAHLASAIS